MKSITLDPRAKLSPHFTLAECTVSATADAKGLDNSPDSLSDIINLVRLLSEIVEPVRVLLGNQPIATDSAYRSPEVNGEIAEVGAKKSAHPDGRAMDLQAPPGWTLQNMFDEIRSSSIPFDQLILESGCVHIAIARIGETPRRESLIRHGTPGNWTYERVNT